ncbi:putative ubiquitin-conjugating enzyme E2 38 [Senna tora]|uniref:Putative ubiquitin-conjugating enzyme E2 38 n=1 Tax=Senna tora TaxID=362788 RepID=A0A834SID1_9FABA|nr:putative ubiquitin-conjugating enzyme E2 38 [Senna tora]
MSGDKDLGGTEKTSMRRNRELEEITDVVELAFREFENLGKLQKPPRDHQFISKKQSKMENSLVENINREWEFLMLCFDNSSTYIRTYKERPDLMRAMMVGPEGTPFRDALFCFDIHIPNNYPAHSPRLFYRSYGHHLNPNLNENFTLSAPDADKGFIIFNVDPKPLRIKRVLKPTSEAILCLLKSPPQNFQDFVYGHFRTRAHKILSNFKSHMDDHDETTTRLFFKLVRAFEANGTYCQHHYDKEAYDRALKQDKKNANRWKFFKKV